MTQLNQQSPFNKNHKGTCYLGLYITADRNMQPMENHLWQKAITYTIAFHWTPSNVMMRSWHTLPVMLYPSTSVPAACNLAT